MIMFRIIVLSVLILEKLFFIGIFWIFIRKCWIVECFCGRVILCSGVILILLLLVFVLRNLSGLKILFIFIGFSWCWRYRKMFLFIIWLFCSLNVFSIRKFCKFFRVLSFLMFFIIWLLRWYSLKVIMNYRRRKCFMYCWKCFVSILSVIGNFLFIRNNLMVIFLRWLFDCKNCVVVRYSMVVFFWIIWMICCIVLMFSLSWWIEVGCGGGCVCWCSVWVWAFLGVLF